MLFKSISVFLALASLAVTHGKSIRSRGLTDGPDPRAGKILDCFLVNLDSEEEIKLDGNDDYTPGDSKWSIYCKTEEPGRVDFVKFFYIGKESTQYYSPERYNKPWLQPFWMEGDNDGLTIADVNDVGYLATPGPKAITVKFYTWDGGNKFPGDVKTYHLNAGGGGGPPPVPSPAPVPVSTPIFIQDIIEDTPTFSTLETAVEIAGLEDTFKSPGPFTVFAPTDAAFAALPQGPLAALLADPVALKDLLLYHVLNGELPEATLKAISPATLPTVEGDRVRITTVGDLVKVNTESTIVDPDNFASNGVVHGINKVLCNNDDFTCPIGTSPTVICPLSLADCGCDSSYQCFANSSPTKSCPTGPNDCTCNDGFMFEGGKCIEVLPDIHDIIVEEPTFSTLETAVEITDLVDTLKSPGPFTVFAPTDAAFAALPQGPLAALLADPVALKDLLLYHVVSGEIPEATLKLISPATLTAVNGDPIAITTVGDLVKVNTDSTIVDPDNFASNGVVHGIDKVLCNNNGFTCPVGTNPLVICPQSAADCACNAGGITCPNGFVPTVNCPLTIAEDCECGNTFSCPTGSTASTACPLTPDDCDCGSTDFTCPEGFIPLPSVFCPLSNNDCVCSGAFECPALSSSEKFCPLELSDCECTDEKNTIQDGECKERPLPRAVRCQITRPSEGFAYVWPSSPYENGVFAMLDGKCGTGFHLRKGAITGERQKQTNTARCYGFGQIYYMYLRDTLTGKESNSVRCTPAYYSSPIGIDVDGSGAVERIDGNFTIDISGDGNMEFLHEWFAPTEGILISMTPFIKNGKVTGENMFGDMGTQYKDGYEKLGLLDSNNDQIVSGTELQGLAIWLDVNSNTLLDDDELFSLENYGITGLRTDEHGHFESSAILEDGTELYMEDLWFTSERHEEATRGTDSA